MPILVGREHKGWGEWPPALEHIPGVQGVEVRRHAATAARCNTRSAGTDSKHWGGLSGRANDAGSLWPLSTNGTGPHFAITPADPGVPYRGGLYS